MKLGRNDICPCGSGNKLKKCHPELDGTVIEPEDKEWQEWFEEDLAIGRSNLDRMKLDQLGITDGYFIKYP